MSYPNQRQQQYGYPPLQGYNPQKNPTAGGYGERQPGVFGELKPHPGPVQRGQPQSGNGADGQSQQQPGANGYPPQKPQQHVQAQPVTGQAMAVANGPPPLLVYVNDQRDVYYLTRYSTAYIVTICVALLTVGASSLYFIAGAGTWLVGVLAAASVIGIVVCSWRAHESKINFEHDSKVVRVTEKRLFQHFCQETTLEQVNYRQLGDAGYTGGPNAIGELFFDLGDKRFPLGQRMYQTELQIASDVEPWRAYLRRLREMDGGPGGLVSQITNAVTSTDDGL